VGRPTPYIGAPSEVNYFFFAGPDYSGMGSAFFLSRPSSFARRASPSGVMPPVLFLGIPVGLFLTSKNRGGSGVLAGSAWDFSHAASISFMLWLINIHIAREHIKVWVAAPASITSI
jgi:hypothetical protein